MDSSIINETSPVELWPTSSPDDVQAVIRAVYKYVLGNPHVMESERLEVAESQLRDRTMSVREFVQNFGTNVARQLRNTKAAPILG